MLIAGDMLREFDGDEAAMRAAVAADREACAMNQSHLVFPRTVMRDTINARGFDLVTGPEDLVIDRTIIDNVTQEPLASAAGGLMPAAT